MEKLDFIKLMLNNRYLSINDKKRLLNLATHEIEAINSDESDNEQEQQPPQKEDSKNKPHKPKDTAIFLSLFNDPSGFKFLTHKYDPGMEVDYEVFIEQIRETFKEKANEYTIPTSLWNLMNVVLNGGTDENGVMKTWQPFDGQRQRDNYACDKWVDWLQRNPGNHLLSNENFKETIMLFRNTIRLVSPSLEIIVQELEQQNKKLRINPHNLKWADFYTYVFYLKNGIARILEDMSKYGDHPQINISFESKYSEDFSQKIIKITQIGSESYDFDNKRKKFHSGGGDFNGIKKYLYGYCNWSVEAKWDGRPIRWNILDDTDRPEVEELNNTQIEGFTHILTYYYK